MQQQLKNSFEPVTSIWLIIASVVIVFVITAINFSHDNIPYILLVVILAAASVLDLLAWLSLLRWHIYAWKSYLTTRKLLAVAGMLVLLALATFVTLFSIAIIVNPPK